MSKEESINMQPFPTLKEITFPKKEREPLEDIISKTIDEVKQRICDDYCRYTSDKEAAEIESLWDSDLCNSCPLNLL